MAVTMVLEDLLAKLLENTVEGSKEEGRNAEIVIHYLGWDGQGGTSMEEVGQKYGISRERVRQILNGVIDEARENYRLHRDIRKGIEKVIKAVTSASPASAQAVEQHLVDKSLVRDRFDIRGIIRFIEFINVKAPFIKEELEGELYIVPKELILSDKITKASRERLLKEDLIIKKEDGYEIKDEIDEDRIEDLIENGSFEHRAPAKMLRGEAIRRVIHEGVINIESLEPMVSAHTPKRISRAHARRFIESVMHPREDYQEFDNGWFWFAEAGRNRLYTHSRKAIAIGGKISMSELREALFRSLRDLDTLPPANIIGQALDSKPEFNYQDNILSLAQDVDLSEILKESELVMVEVMRENGNTMKQKNFADACAERGVSNYKFSMSLNYSPIFYKTQRGLYHLIGSNA